jgi:endonuclease/exonuclease/phosphatase (EEP) superfamily protein YafD
MLRQIVRAIVELSAAAAVLYGVTMLLYWIARIAVGESWQIITFANSLMPTILLPALPFAALMLIARRPRIAAVLAPSVVAWAALYGGLFVPPALRQGVPIPDDARRVTVMTWNLHGMTDDAELEGALALIRAVDADIVALQEFTQPADDYLTRQLDDRYPYTALHPYAYSVNGVGLYSRFPVYADEFWVWGLGNMRAQLVIDERLITIYNVHPSSPGIRVDTRARTREIAAIIERVAVETTPLLLVGDFNMTDQSDDYARVDALLTDSFREVGVGLGFTFPDLGATNPALRGIPPIIRIDYIWHNADWAAISARVHETAGGSDHFPVIAALALLGT